MAAELPLTVQSVSVTLPNVEHAAAVAGRVAADRAVGERHVTEVIHAAAERRRSRR